MRQLAKGYTLIELVTVILMLVVLSVYAVPRLSGAETFSVISARDSALSVARQVQLRAIQQESPSPQKPNKCQRLQVTDKYFGAPVDANCGGKENEVTFWICLNHPFKFPMTKQSFILTSWVDHLIKMVSVFVSRQIVSSCLKKEMLMQRSALTAKAFFMPVARKNVRRTAQQGFTLVESVLGIVVFGFAMILLGTTVFPLLSQSPAGHFESRASALGQAVMNKVLAAKYDRESEAGGTRWRCGENAQALKSLGYNPPEHIPACAGLPSKQQAGQFASLDDFNGCWGETSKACPTPDTVPYLGQLPELLGSWSHASGPLDFSHYTVNVAIVPHSKTFAAATETHPMKQVNVTVITPKYGKYEFTAYRSNY